jgi:hypothetical protein
MKCPIAVLDTIPARIITSQRECHCSKSMTVVKSRIQVMYTETKKASESSTFAHICTTMKKTFGKKHGLVTH